MEPRWSTSDVKIIFGDEFLKQSLLTKLGMTQTCTLRCDYYHLMQQIWPKAFGIVLMHNMSKYLRAMLLSNTKLEWDKAYGYALNFVITDQKNEKCCMKYTIT